MKLYEVIVRDNYNGKKFIYFVSASSESTARAEGRIAHHNVTNHPGEVVQVTLKSN